jgi:hypothetical protein
MLKHIYGRAYLCIRESSRSDATRGYICPVPDGPSNCSGKRVRRKPRPSMWRRTCRCRRYKLRGPSSRCANPCQAHRRAHATSGQRASLKNLLRILIIRAIRRPTRSFYYNLPPLNASSMQIDIRDSITLSNHICLQIAAFILTIDLHRGI